MNLPTVRRPGRPRSAEADEAILEAALDLFAKRGYEGLSVEAVAAQAGVSKATIYRRYPSKTDLVIASCQRLAARVPPPDTGTLRGDLESIVGNLCRKLRTSVEGRAIAQMVSEMTRNPGLADAHHGFVAERRQRGIDALRRGVERGEVRSDIDVDLAADLVAGPIFYRALVSGGRIDERFARQHVAELVRYLAP